jgi:dolichol-phosphate mannosyltransferase
MPQVLPVNDWQVPTYETIELKPRSTKYCVVVPVINEGGRIAAELRSMKEHRVAQVADIIIADGGSTDGSLEAEALRAMEVRCRLTKTGPGKLSAQLRMGYSYALAQGYEGIVTIDGNNKDGVDAIPRFIAELESGVDVVQGSRFVRGGKAIHTPWVRTLAIKLIHAPALSLAAGFRYTDTTNGYRGYSRRYLLDPRVSPFRDIFMTYELLPYLNVRGPKLGYKTKEIPVTRSYPAKGPTPTKLRGHAYFELLKIVAKAMAGAYDPA